MRFYIFSVIFNSTSVTNRPTDQPTDRASYRGAMPHLKTHLVHHSCYSSYASTVRSIGLGIGMIELGIGLKINNAGAPSWPVYPALLLLFDIHHSF